MEAALDTAEIEVKKVRRADLPQLNLAENGCSRRPKLPKSGNSFPWCIFPAVQFPVHVHALGEGVGLLLFQKGCLLRPVMDDAAPKDDAMDESLPSRQSKSKSNKKQIKVPAPKPSFSFGERKEHSTQAQPSCMETNFPISAGAGAGGGGPNRRREEKKNGGYETVTSP